MKVKDMIEKLQQFDPELPVAIADWNEEWADPSIEAAGSIMVSNVPIWEEGVKRKERKCYPAVVIGL